jgi:DNA-binding NarL/FixJ family response regulator
VTIRIVLAEDSFLVREGVRRMLSSEPELDVVASCGDLDELLAAIDEHRPDVVLTDIRMPPNHSDEGIRAAEHCRTAYPDMGVVLLSQYVQPAYVKALLGQGTEGRAYLLKERVAQLSDVVGAVREVARGGSAIDPKVVEALVTTRERGPHSELAQLTPRERQVLAAMAEGRNNASVAEELVLTQRAVEKHINSIFAKLRLSGDQQGHPRVRAVLLYLSGQGVPS